MTHMFQLAQEAVRGPETANTSQAPAPPPVVQPDTALEEELQLMRERIALFESRFEALLAERKVLEQERNQLQSEAAVARAELRRWKKQVTALVDDGNRPATPAAILDTPN
ncbi:hypothetical protein AGDE_14626 [Angomonas deanei]|uniref:Uncharacterized protein n=1 Tax=Angomonas deanei TaxID=59799 RepID=A0A7G2CSW2_9TRYP|nr:hypothetical protein AGDE_14626 [Angomonas deanei]CAD2222419.1 hypothetical protein, conserved [Angomonas deanei]|eukprot:EPY20527.1 hypothetical protein AGDE_14626 [Angomonas deanei]